MTSPLDAWEDLIGKTLRVENADNDMLNVVDVDTGTRYWIESTGKLLVFEREFQNEDDLDSVS